MRICLLGATGLVGRETLDLVARAWPDATLSLYASRDQELKHGAKAYKVEGAPKLEEESAPEGDLAFVALDDDHSKRSRSPVRAPCWWRLYRVTQPLGLEPVLELPARVPCGTQVPRRFRGRSGPWRGAGGLRERYARAVPKIDRTPDGGKAD